MGLTSRWSTPQVAAIRQHRNRPLPSGSRLNRSQSRSCCARQHLRSPPPRPPEPGNCAGVSGVGDHTVVRSRDLAQRVLQLKLHVLRSGGGCAAARGRGARWGAVRGGCCRQPTLSRRARGGGSHVRRGGRVGCRAGVGGGACVRAWPSVRARWGGASGGRPAPSEG